MSDTPKKRVARSPNYPMLPLEWAVSTALSLMERESLHAVPADIFARHLGYKDATNGKVRRVLANLKAFGVLERASNGKLSVSKDIQRYKLLPNESDRHVYLSQWLRSPLLFQKLLEKYPDDLPSDAVLLFELVDEHGFSEQGAEKAIEVFRASVDFASKHQGQKEIQPDELDDFKGDESVSPIEPVAAPTRLEDFSPMRSAVVPTPPSHESIRYPVRLAGGRMAYIDVPTPFREIDKKKLQAQIEIIGTDDEDAELDM